MWVWVWVWVWVFVQEEIDPHPLSLTPTPATKRKREDSEGNVRSSSKVPRDKSGVRDVVMATKARKINKLGQRKMNLDARLGESDRRIFTEKPKHLCKLLIFFVFVF